MRPADYQEVIAAALAEDRAATRMEGAARMTFAMLYSEAAKAHRDATRIGFPLWIASQGESFRLGTGTARPGDPMVKFERSGETIVRQASHVAAAAIDGEAREEWTPGKEAAEAVEQRIRASIVWAVSALARNHGRAAT